MLVRTSPTLWYMREKDRARRIFLPIGIWLLLAVCTGLVAVLQLRDVTGDRGMSNVLTFFLLLIPTLVASVW